MRHWCEGEGIDFVMKRIDNLTRGVTQRDEYEELTRNIRYDLYKEAMRQQGVQGVCVGHHRGDVQADAALAGTCLCCDLTCLWCRRISLGISFVGFRCSISMAWGRPPLPMGSPSGAHCCPIPRRTSTSLPTSTESPTSRTQHRSGALVARPAIASFPSFKTCMVHHTQQPHMLLPFLRVLTVGMLGCEGDGVLEKLSEMGSASKQLRSMVAKSALEPFWAGVRLTPTCAVVPVATFAEEPVFFWREAMKEVCHRLGTGKIGEKPLKILRDRLLNPKGKEGWVALKRDNKAFLLNGHITLFRGIPCWTIARHHRAMSIV